MTPENVKHEDCMEMNLYFFVEKQITYSAYTMSEGDKCAIEYISQNLNENQSYDDYDDLQDWIVPDNPKRKKRIEPAKSYEKEHISLFDILVAAAQIIMVILAWKWWVW